MPSSEQRLPALRLRDRTYAWGTRTMLMGVINTTPDSFSGDGTAGDANAAVRLAMDFADAGVDFIDMGGESTRPGHVPVSEREELQRVVPAIAAVRAAVDVPISIDTFKPVVAVEALAAGADMINCVWGAIPGIVELASRARVPLIVMHNRVNTDYERDCVVEVIESLDLAARYVRDADVPPEHIIVDPGIGFGKTADHNVQILSRLREFVEELPYPLLVGVSRKSFIGKITGQPVEDRVFGTAAAVALAIAGGADIVRVHDVVAMRAVVDVADALTRIGAAQAPARGTQQPNFS
ncbi:MAG: dihydropteroate synthase [Candidatus Eremiobacteraeota bacterium]|nr:dihydropteroate synthase [Candidatus Eremiobacteraeota bacterium]MBV8460195.1 dihydropteroate synthase [Candidatus Eremiobacteraeota bacterium]MBV8596032.1 dihydropteroate synthase [Candidatus Eremiobacteraeota bacterium]MBV8668862.1 dihydropteroate synthase [Candidatus Eremiobacteraeota bacterium]